MFGIKNKNNIANASVSHNHTLPLSCSGFINYAVKQTERLKVSSPIPGLKATNINNKSTFVWLLHYTASRVHPVSTFPYLILKMRTKNNNNGNNIDNSKEKRQLAVERGVKTEGMKTPVCLCVCVWLVSPSELIGSLFALVGRRLA